jgi:hypothetical protein
MFIATSRKGHGESILSGLERNRFTGEGHFPESETAPGAAGRRKVCLDHAELPKRVSPAIHDRKSSTDNRKSH